MSSTGGNVPPREVTAIRGGVDWRTPDGEQPAAVHVGYAMSRGHRIAYEVAGEGQAILLVPGFAMLAADWREMGYVQALSTSRRVLTVDTLGHGLSDQPIDEAAYRWPDVAEDLIAVLDAEGVDRAVLWGYSRGAGLAASAAAHHPDRSSAVILGGADDFGPLPPFEPGGWSDRLWHGDWNALADIGLLGTDDDLAYMREWFDPRALGAASVGNRMSGAAAAVDLSSVTSPALIYAGGNDHDPAALAASAAQLRTSAVVLDGLDHAQAFVARDRILPAVLEFLDAHGL